MLITFEGPEGSGKTTQIALFAEALRQEGLSPVITREPGGTSIGDQIRRVILDKSNSGMCFMTEALLYTAARAQLVNELIMPALADKKIVVCDRFYDSLTAYQGYARGMDLMDLRNLTTLSTIGIKPDITIYLDLSVREGLRRKFASSQETNRLDIESLDFHERVVQGYYKIMEQDPWRWILVDADRSPELVHSDIMDQCWRRIDYSIGIDGRHHG